MWKKIKCPMLIVMIIYCVPLMMNSYYYGVIWCYKEIIKQHHNFHYEKLLEFGLPYSSKYDPTEEEDRIFETLCDRAHYFKHEYCDSSDVLLELKMRLWAHATLYLSKSGQAVFYKDLQRAEKFHRSILNYFKF